MSKVGACTDVALSLLRSRGIEAVLEINPGNHFSEPARRMAMGLAWCLENRCTFQYRPNFDSWNIYVSNTR